MKDNQEWGALSEGLRAASLGWDLALPIFAGVLLGHALDNRLGVGYVFTVGLLLLGVFGGYYNMSRSVKRIEMRIQHRKMMAKGKERGETNTSDGID